MRKVQEPELGVLASCSVPYKKSFPVEHFVLDARMTLSKWDPEGARKMSVNPEGARQMSVRMILG